MGCTWDELHSVDDLQMLHHLCRHLTGADCIQRKLHGKKVIGISAESLPVEKVSPAADDLPEDNAAAGGISQKAKGNLLFFLLK